MSRRSRRGGSGVVACGRNRDTEDTEETLAWKYERRYEIEKPGASWIEVEKHTRLDTRRLYFCPVMFCSVLFGWET